MPPFWLDKNINRKSKISIKCTKLNIRTISREAFWSSDKSDSVAIKRLNLNNNVIAALDDNLFVQLPNLLYLSLENNLITTIPEALFALNPKIKEINLRKNIIDDVRFDFGALASLETLNLDYNMLARLERHVFETYVESSRRPTLTIRGNNFRCDCALLWVRYAAVEARLLYDADVKCRRGLLANVSVKCVLFLDCVVGENVQQKTFLKKFFENCRLSG